MFIPFNEQTNIHYPYWFDSRKINTQNGPMEVCLRIRPFWGLSDGSLRVHHISINSCYRLKPEREGFVKELRLKTTNDHTEFTIKDMMDAFQQQFWLFRYLCWTLVATEGLEANEK